MKERSIGEQGLWEKDLALVDVKGVIANSRFEFFIKVWNLCTVSEYSLLFKTLPRTTLFKDHHFW